MSVHEWVQLAFEIGGWVCLILLSIDKWVHKQDLDQQSGRANVKHLEDRQIQIERMLVEANDLMSRKHSEIHARLGRLELDMREVKTVLRLRNTHQRPSGPRTDPT